MSANEPESKGEDSFDVVWMHGPTADGEGTRVVRARPGRVDAGELRPMVDGRPLAGGGEVVRLERRPEGPALFDVKVECKVPGAEAKAKPADDREPSAASGPPQVATRAYRENWELTFGGSRDKSLN
ncbi:MAG TPA: hypothetical protein VGM06_07850 [Polyangiaceae bacterium]|jgi:hypothetical protein